MRAGRLLRVDGALACAGNAGQAITVALHNPAFPKRVQIWNAKTKLDGTFTAWLRPRISGTILAAFAGSPDLQPTSVQTARQVRIVPVIRATFHANRTAYDFWRDKTRARVRDLRVAELLAAGNAYSK